MHSSIKVSLKFCENSVPVFHKEREITYPLREKVLKGGETKSRRICTTLRRLQSWLKRT